MDENFDEV